jgi:tetratricopeptide (TPR) repeat protein
MRLELAHAYRDLGLLYSARGQYQQALAEWQQAQMIYEDEKAASQLARLYCDMGKARKALGQGSRALKDYESALLLLSSVDLETRGVLLSNAASAYAEGGDVESADDFFAESISIAHKLGDKQAEAMRRGNHGWFLVITGRARRATAALEQAVHVSRDAGLNLAVAVQTDNLGLAQMELSAFEAALHYHQQALELIDKLNQPRWEAIFKANAARALLALQRADDAEPLLNAALEYGRAHNDFEVLIRALCRRAELLMRHRGDAAGAGDLLTEAVTLARRADIRHLLADALALHSEQQALVGERDHAAALWGDAARLYSLLHHPLAKGQPTWLSTPETTK